jgi:23S rRNA (cytosine1962-C5)-methyltransferase
VTAIIVLKPGRERSLQRRHPWVFSGAVARLEGQPVPGETVRVLSSAGAFLAWAAYSPQSQIQLRVWTWDESETVDEAFLRRRVAAAVNSRRLYFPVIDNEPVEGIRGVNAIRLVHGESDGLPGLVVDRYDRLLVVQILSCGAEYWRDVLIESLRAVTGLTDVYERSDADVRSLEGLAPRVGPVPMNGPVPGRVQIYENGLKFWVDIAAGHKTGFYLDQRANRLRLRQLSAGRDVLDCFAYTGGFTLNALLGGAASVVSVDNSANALELARENLALNNLPGEKVEFVQADVFHYLRTLRDQARSFDLVILDPPKFASTSAQVERAARGYKDINLLALKLLRPDGILVTFSCSGGVGPELFQKIVAGAALDASGSQGQTAGAEALIVERLHQDADHPVALNFPEGEYLKGLVISAPT